jgi:hypothetical protein
VRVRFSLPAEKYSARVPVVRLACVSNPTSGTLNMKKNSYLKYVLQALAIAVFGFILLIIAFMFDGLVHSILIYITRFIAPTDVMMNIKWFPPFMHFIFVLIIGLISWFIFRSKLGILYKAIFMVVPVAVILVTIGMFLYRFPLVPYLVGAVLSFTTLYYFFRTKQSWLYYYSVILIAIVLTIFTLTGGEI